MYYKLFKQLRQICSIVILIPHQAPLPGEGVGEGDHFLVVPQAPHGVGPGQDADAPVVLGPLQHKVYLRAGDVDLRHKTCLDASLLDLADETNYEKSSGKR